MYHGSGQTYRLFTNTAGQLHYRFDYSIFHHLAEMSEIAIFSLSQIVVHFSTPKTFWIHMQRTNLDDSERSELIYILKRRWNSVKTEENRSERVTRARVIAHLYYKYENEIACILNGKFNAQKIKPKAEDTETKA